MCLNSISNSTLIFLICRVVWMQISLIVAQYYYWRSGGLKIKSGRSNGNRLAARSHVCTHFLNKIWILCLYGLEFFSRKHLEMKHLISFEKQNIWRYFEINRRPSFNLFKNEFKLERQSLCKFWIYYLFFISPFALCTYYYLILYMQPKKK